ncbi:MAG TPA: pilus assembly protein PilM [Humisphaera sp.]|jgi:type IV pilus assembly protein PilM|nr:pilus assembly protein PilM [Humisphaera sp.]
MFGLSRDSRSPIGIDIGTRRIKAMQLDRAGSRICAVAMMQRLESAAIPSSHEVGRLAATLERAGFIGNRIVLAVPPDMLLSDVLELPRSLAQLEQLARMEVARTHRCAPDALEVGAWELPASARPAKTAKVMTVAVRHDDVNPLLEAFDQQHLEVVALDARCAVLARAIESTPADEKSITAILDYGWNAATLVLMRQGIVFYERKIVESGLSRLHRELCERLRVEGDVADFLLSDEEEGLAGDAEAHPEARAALLTHMEALTTEMLASFNYAGQQYEDAALGRLLMTGGGAVTRGFTAHLENTLGVQVKALAPADLLPFRPEHTQLCRSPSLMSALGLAMFPLQKCAESVVAHAV